MKTINKLLILTICIWASACSPNSKLVGVWRGEDGEGSNTEVNELTIKHTETGLECVDKIWGKDVSKGGSIELKYPLRQISSETWEGEYRGDGTFDNLELKNSFNLVGNELHLKRFFTQAPSTFGTMMGPLSLGSNKKQTWEVHVVLHRY